MSKRRALFVVAAMLASGIAWPTTGHAQTAAELRARLDSASQRFSAARARLDSAQNQARAVPDSVMQPQGAVVNFDSRNLGPRERAALTRAFTLAADELEAIFGPEGPALLEGQVWLVSVAGGGRSGLQSMLALEALENGQRTTTGSMRLPLDVTAAAELIRGQAGRRLIAGNPRIRAWTGGGFSIGEPTEIHYFSHRHLALHQSSPARRCARGTIASCADLLDPAARARWFDPGDPANGDRAPASGIVRESVLRYAIEVDGPAVLQAFSEQPDTTLKPVAFLAAAVRQSPEQFLTGWQAEAAQAGAVRVKALPRTVFAALGWFAFCGIVATRRRPR